MFCFLNAVHVLHVCAYFAGLCMFVLVVHLGCLHGRKVLLGWCALLNGILEGSTFLEIPKFVERLL